MSTYNILPAHVDEYSALTADSPEAALMPNPDLPELQALSAAMKRLYHPRLIWVIGT